MFTYFPPPPPVVQIASFSRTDYAPRTCYAADEFDRVQDVCGIFWLNQEDGYKSFDFDFPDSATLVSFRTEDDFFTTRESSSGETFYFFNIYASSVNFNQYRISGTCATNASATEAVCYPESGGSYGYKD